MEDKTNFFQKKFEKIHSWFFLEYGISITRKTINLLILLILSIIFLIGSLIYGRSVENSVSNQTNSITNYDGTI